MFIVMKDDATPLDIEEVLARLRASGAQAECYCPRETLISVPWHTNGLDEKGLALLPGVGSIHRRGCGYWLASRKRQAHDTVVEVMGRRFGGDSPPVLIAGPCAVESQDQLFRTAEAVIEAGAGLMRGGAFKPRTSPYSFQGLGEAGLELLARARERFGIPVVVEMRDAATLELFLRYEIDVIQIGARNMQNFEILRQAGRAGRPILLKRGPANSIDEWLTAAEYILLEGNPEVILCERGIVPPAGAKTRYLLDIGAIPVVQQLSHLPVIADPSHAAGDRDFVPALAHAAIAAGAHGLLVEAHADPDRALVDGRQSLTPDMLRAMVQEMRAHGYPIGSFESAPWSAAAPAMSAHYRA